MIRASYDLLHGAVRMCILGHGPLQVHVDAITYQKCLYLVFTDEWMFLYSFIRI